MVRRARSTATRQWKVATGTGGICALLFSAFLAAGVASAEQDVFFTGDGHSGRFAAPGLNTIINAYAAVTSARSPGDRTIPVSSEAGFSTNDLVMIVQAAGYLPAPDAGTPGPFDISADPTGSWELARVASVSAGVLNLTQPLLHFYSATGTQVIKIPEYTTLTVPAGASLIASTWDGSSVVNNGLISATAAGFRGGIVVNDDRPAQALGCTAMDELPVDGGQKGEGISTSRYDAAFGRGNVANGGGGADCHNSGGGGGGNGGSGGQGGFSWSGDQSRDVGGLGGGSLRYSLSGHLTLGGGGGAGHENDNAGSSGGRGGGAIFIRGGSMPDGGVIAANGQNAPNAPMNDGAGGGGGGGTIYLRFAGPVACSSVTASGGNGGSVPVAQHGPGGGGGGGRILLQGTDTSGCPASVLSGIAGTQSDPNAPGGPHYGAQPSANDVPGHVGTVETLPGGFTPASPTPGGSNTPYLAGSCGCRAGPLGPVGAILPLLLSIAAFLLLRRRRIFDRTSRPRGSPLKSHKA